MRKQPLLAVLAETINGANEDSHHRRPHLLGANREGPVEGREECQQEEEEEEEGMLQPTLPHPTALPMSIITIIKWLWLLVLMLLAKNSSNNMNNQTQ
jgi:hypothetical protein